MNQRHKVIALGAAVFSGLVLGALALHRLCAKHGKELRAPQQEDGAPDELVCSHNPPDQGPNTNPVDTAGGPLAPKRELDPLKIACAEDFQDWDEMGCWG